MHQGAGQHPELTLLKKQQKKFIAQKSDVLKKKKELEICTDEPGYDGMEGFKLIFD